MNDRVHSLTVVLENDVRVGDLVPLKRAIEQLRGVLAVKQHVTDIVTTMSHERARRELSEKLWAVLHPKKEGPRT